MEELIFFGIIILFSIAESIARSRKAKARKESGEAAEPEMFEWAQTPPWEEEPPTYDADPSYDDAHAAGTKTAEPPSGESAADVWAEIAGLASGTKQKAGEAKRPTPRESPPPPAPAAPEPVPTRAPQPSRAEEAKALQAARRAEAARTRLPDRTTAVSRPPARRPTPEKQHEVHLAHVGYGTDPSSRAPSEQDGLDPLAERISADAAAIHGQLRSRDPSALRQAMILQEVLSPPISLRE